MSPNPSPAPPCSVDLGKNAAPAGSSFSNPRPDSAKRPLFQNPSFRPPSSSPSSDPLSFPLSSPPERRTPPPLSRGTPPEKPWPRTARYNFESHDPNSAGNPSPPESPVGTTATQIFFALRPRSAVVPPNGQRDQSNGPDPPSSSSWSEIWETAHPNPLAPSKNAYHPEN